MLRSLFSGITGLRAHQTLMDVTSNNISNVNTTGFKGSSVVFEDTLSQLMRSAGMPSTDSSGHPLMGGINPAQVGLGVQVGGITTNFGQGSAQNTGKPTDLMIQGDGFFVVQNGNQTAYTRAGAFNFDTNGMLVNAEGMRVQGWTAVNGVVNTNAAQGDIKIPAGTMMPPTATQNVKLTGNITAGTTTPITIGVTAYDKAGTPHSLSIAITSNGNGGFDVNATDATDTNSTPTAGTLAFLTGGVYDPASTSATMAFADGTTATIDLAGATAFGGPKSLAATSVDGAEAGSLEQFQINPDGTIVGVFSNQQKLPLAVLALANFNNPSGLLKIGDTSFVESANSGLPQVGTPGGGGRGTLLGSSLEMSNVDLAQEFTNMIIAQRGFQANSRVITTSDQMLQDLVDLKR